MSSSCWLLFASSKEIDPELGERCRSNPHAVEIGVGKTHAAATTARILAQRSPGDPSAVFLFGVAGAYRESGLEIGALRVVVASESVDEGVELEDREFRSIEELGLPHLAGRGGYDLDWSRRVASHCRASTARASTVSTCSGSDELAGRRFARNRNELETMESAAVAFACAEAGVRLCELRCVSNYCGNRDRGEWDLARAAAALSESVSRLLQEGLLI